MQKQILKRGIKILIDNQHIKTIPFKYEKVFKKEHIKCFDNKRLTTQEIFSLEVELLKLELKKTNHLVFEIIENSNPLKTRKVKTKTKEYFEIVFNNSTSLVCPSKFYKISESKEEIFRNY